jgi:hypothetical protein
VLTHGGMGYAKEYHVERYFRESMLPRIAPVSPQLILSFIAEKVRGSFISFVVFDKIVPSSSFIFILPKLSRDYLKEKLVDGRRLIPNQSEHCRDIVCQRCIRFSGINGVSLQGLKVYVQSHHRLSGKSTGRTNCRGRIIVRSNNSELPSRSYQDRSSDQSDKDQ